MAPKIDSLPPDLLQMQVDVSLLEPVVDGPEAKKILADRPDQAHISVAVIDDYARSHPKLPKTEVAALAGLRARVVGGVSLMKQNHLALTDDKRSNLSLELVDSNSDDALTKLIVDIDSGALKCSEQDRKRVSDAIAQLANTVVDGSRFHAAFAHSPAGPLARALADRIASNIEALPDEMDSFDRALWEFGGIYALSPAHLHKLADRLHGDQPIATLEAFAGALGLGYPGVQTSEDRDRVAALLEARSLSSEEIAKLFAIPGVTVTLGSERTRALADQAARGLASQSPFLDDKDFQTLSRYVSAANLPAVCQGTRSLDASSTVKADYVRFWVRDGGQSRADLKQVLAWDYVVNESGHPAAFTAAFLDVLSTLGPAAAKQLQVALGPDAIRAMRDRLPTIPTSDADKALAAFINA